MSSGKLDEANNLKLNTSFKLLESKCWNIFLYTVNIAIVNKQIILSINTLTYLYKFEISDLNSWMLLKMIPQYWSHGMKTDNSDTYWLFGNIYKTSPPY